MLTHCIGRIVALASLAVVSGCTFVQPYQAVSKQTHSVTHVASSPIHVESRNGSVEVIGDSTRTDVEVDATIRCSGKSQVEADQRLAQVHLDITRNADQALRIEPIFPDEKQGNDGASFVIRIPDARGVTVNTSNGRITIENLAGQLVADTSNASVIVRQHDGPARIDTSNGGVRVSGVHGEVTIDTSNGSIEADDVHGPAKVDTSNGSVKLALAGDQAGPIRVDSSNGSVRVSVGSAFNSEVVVSTSNGRVKVIDGAGRVRSQVIDDDDGRITIGDGGSRSIISTSNASVEIAIEK